jgi:hypothetical protein
MNTREQQTQERPIVSPPSVEDERVRHEEARDTGEAFLVAADAAIERALSGNAEAFLTQNRQLGGQ